MRRRPEGHRCAAGARQFRRDRPVRPQLLRDRRHCRLLLLPSQRRGCERTQRTSRRSRRVAAVGRPAASRPRAAAGFEGLRGLHAGWERNRAEECRCRCRTWRCAQDSGCGVDGVKMRMACRRAGTLSGQGRDLQSSAVAVWGAVDSLFRFAEARGHAPRERTEWCFGLCVASQRLSSSMRSYLIPNALFLRGVQDVVGRG